MLEAKKQYQDYIGEIFKFGEKSGEVSCTQPLATKIVTFQVTDGCSLRCTYCYQIEKCSNIMTFDKAKVLIDYILEHRKEPDFYFSESHTKALIFEFIGGEPFMATPLIRQIIEYCEEKLLENSDSLWLTNHVYNICSNGVAYFNDDVQDLLRDYGDIISLGITVDGTKELHDKCRLFPNGEGSYDLAVAAAVDNMNRFGNDGTKITLSPENIEYVFAAVKNMYSLGFKYIYMNCVFEDVWHPEDAVKLFYQLKQTAEWIVENNLQEQIYFLPFDSSRYQPSNFEYSDRNWCGANDNMLAIDWKGDLFPCIRFMSSSLGEDQPEYIVGHIDHGIGVTESEKANLQGLRKLTKSCQSEQKCADCTIGSGCSWCTAYNYQKTGRVDKREINICEMHKAMALGAYYFEMITTGKSLIGILDSDALNIVSQEELNNMKGDIICPVM